ncbi:MAG: hypothetical protein ABJO36_10915 [Litorimonas sp.]
MYLRFVSPLKHGGSARPRDLHMGLFQAVIHCRDNVDMPTWLHAQIIEEFEWFKEYLPSPDDKYFRYWYVRDFHWDSICWFKASAHQMINRAWALKALIEETGMPLSVVGTKNPGSIRYEDRYQIVANPLRSDLPKFG